jgi:hypothetical protein
MTSVSIITTCSKMLKNREAQYFATHPQQTTQTPTPDANQQPAQQDSQTVDPNQQTAQ